MQKRMEGKTQETASKAGMSGFLQSGPLPSPSVAYPTSSRCCGMITGKLKATIIAGWPSSIRKGRCNDDYRIGRVRIRRCTFPRCSRDGKPSSTSPTAGNSGCPSRFHPVPGSLALRRGPAFLALQQGLQASVGFSLAATRIEPLQGPLRPALHPHQSPRGVGLISGSRDFHTTDDYADFVRQMVERRNRLVEGKLEQDV